MIDHYELAEELCLRLVQVKEFCLKHPGTATECSMRQQMTFNLIRYSDRDAPPETLAVIAAELPLIEDDQPMKEEVNRVAEVLRRELG